MKTTSLLIAVSICASGCATQGVFSSHRTPDESLLATTPVALIDLRNPATPRQIPSGDHHYRISMHASGGYELGEVADFINRIDDLEAELTRGTRNLSLNSYFDQFGTDGLAIANAVVADLNTHIIDVVNRQIDLLTTRSSYATAFGSLDAPVQFAQPGMGGVFDFRTGVTSARDVWAVGDPLQEYTLVDLEQRVTDAINSAEPSLDYLLPENDTAVLVRTAIVNTLSLGYSRPMMDLGLGQVIVGVRGNYYKAEMTRYAKRLTDFVREELSIEYQNEYSDDNGHFASAFGTDVGIAWIAPQMRLGAMINNVNESKFTYRRVEETEFSGSAVPNLLNANRTWKLQRQLRLEGGLNSLDRQWSLGTTVDGNTVEDPLGHEYRWFSAGAAYSPRGSWLPGLRLRYHANTVGSETRYITTGFTLFNSVSLDMTRSLDSVYIEENDAVSYHGSAPRSLIYSLRIELGI